MTQPAYRRHERLRRLRLSFRAKLAQVRGLEAENADLRTRLLDARAEIAIASGRAGLFGFGFGVGAAILIAAIRSAWR